MFAFFKNLHIDLNVAIEKRENFDATIDFETISAQNIDFRDVAIDEINNTFFERSRTISDVNIEKNKNFDDEKDEKMIDRNDETKNEKIIDSKTNETTTNC